MRKFFLRLPAIIVAISLLSSCTASNPNWQEVYYEDVLANYESEKDSTSFFLIDLTMDDIPELVITKEGRFYDKQIYTFANGEVTQIHIDPEIAPMVSESIKTYLFFNKTSKEFFWGLPKNEEDAREYIYTVRYNAKRYEMHLEELFYWEYDNTIEDIVYRVGREVVSKEAYDAAHRQWWADHVLVIVSHNNNRSK